MQEIVTSNSHLRQVECRRNGERHKKAVNPLQHLRILNLSFNALTKVDDSITSLSHLQEIDLSNNKITHISCDFSLLSNLQHLDMSNNQFDDSIDSKVLIKLPPNLIYLNISGNPWPCLPKLSWLHSWSQKLSPTLFHQVSQTECTVPNTHHQSPLLRVMEYYSNRVTPHCPNQCFCTFYHFSSGKISPPTYTVLVNCTNQNLSSFPTLPPHTTILDLTGNILSDSSYNSLDIAEKNYGELSGLILSHNKFSFIDPKLNKLKLHRLFRIDHNNLSEIPYDFSQGLQSSKPKISFSQNRWNCDCGSEITNLVRVNN